MSTTLRVPRPLIQHEPRQRQSIPVISHDDVPSHVDIVPSLFAATKAADAEQQADDAIGRQQSQRQQFIDVLDAAYQQALRGNLKFVIDFTTPDLEGDWLIDWAVGKGITEISHRYENGDGSTTNAVDVNGRRFARIVQLAAVSK